MLDYHGRPIFFSAVHPLSPYPANAAAWSEEMGRIATWLDDVDGLAVVAGDFNATRDHKQFRDILDTGFEDAADPGRRRVAADVSGQPTAHPAARRHRPRPRPGRRSWPPMSTASTSPTPTTPASWPTLMVPPAGLVDDTE